MARCAWARISKHYRDLKDGPRCLINQQNNPLFMLKKSDAERENSERVWDIRTVCWDEMRAWLFSSQQGHGICHQHHCTETSLSALNGILLAAVSQRVTCVALILLIICSIKWSITRRNEWIKWMLFDRFFGQMWPEMTWTHLKSINQSIKWLEMIHTASVMIVMCEVTL